jgi:hypothetical protein
VAGEVDVDSSVHEADGWPMSMPAITQRAIINGMNLFGFFVFIIVWI